MTNINTPRAEHDRYCHQPEGGWLGDMKPDPESNYPSNWGRPGDVRRCVHGRIMLGFEVPGSVPAYWRDLSPIFNPFLYRRAKRALEREGVQANTDLGPTHSRYYR